MLDKFTMNDVTYGGLDSNTQRFPPTIHTGLPIVGESRQQTSFGTSLMNSKQDSKVKVWAAKFATTPLAGGRNA